MVATSTKVSSKVSSAYPTTTADKDSSLDNEQYSTLLHDLFSFRKQDPNLFQTLMDSFHHHQGNDGEERRRCDLDTTVDDDDDDDDDDIIERSRYINDEREGMDSTTTDAAVDATVSNLFRSETANKYYDAMKIKSMHLSSKKSSKKKMQAKSMLFDSDSANTYYNAMKAKSNIQNKSSYMGSSNKKISWVEKKTNMSKLELLNLQLALESIKVERKKYHDEN